MTRLLLDEMHSPQVAEELRNRGHDVLALVVDPDLRALSDPEVYAWATVARRQVVTENVKDFAPLAAAGEGPGVLLTSSRTFARSRRNPGPLIDALDAWCGRSGERPHTDWLQPAG